MNPLQNNKINAGARWLGIGIGSVLAIVSWYCLLQELRGAAVASIAAMAILLVSLFRPESLAAPVKIWFAGMEMIALCFLACMLLCFYIFVLCPWGMIVAVFDGNFLFRERIQRSRKYQNKSPGSYWTEKRVVSSRI